jgi:hypothetical protein
MALIDTSLGNLINRTAFLYEIGGQKIGFLQLDATVNETHKRSSAISQNEIEDGSNVSDNVVLGNETFSIEGLISESPFPSSDIRDIALQVQNAGFSILNNVIGSVSGGVVQNAAASIKRVVALTQLEAFWKNKIPFTVLTGVKKYDNVLISSMSIPVTARDGKSLRFTVDCEVVKIVTSQVVTIPKNRTAKGATGKQSLGKQGTKTASEEATNRGSILFKAYKGVSG